MRLRTVGLALLPLAFAGAASAAASSTITVAVDATEIARRIIRIHLEIPAAPGPLALVYPKWIPGEHRPTGPIAGLAGLSVQSSGKAVSWRRDADDMYTFHLEVPTGARSVQVTFDFVSSSVPQGFSAGTSASAQLAFVRWQHLVLYPKGARPSDLRVAARLTLPHAWIFGTALAVVRKSAQVVDFSPVSLETLVDAPVLMGAHFRTTDLSTAAGPAHSLHVAGDTPSAIDLPRDVVISYRRLIAESGALFGSRPYPQYQFLLALSDQVAHFGLEHHQSSENRQRERTYLDDDLRLASVGLLPHELVHTWNGKHRRPTGLMTPDYQTPVRTELLWIYEGLTTYLGEVLTARSGLRSPEQQREALALTAASLDTAPGRTWRSLEDTAVAAQTLYGAPHEWRAWRRGLDFYPESLLIWLEADTLIRHKSRDRRSLDDFCGAFFGGAGGTPTVRPYTLDDVLTALASVQSHDWRDFFDSRVRSPTTRAPLGGIEASGWRLVYRDLPSAFVKAIEKMHKTVDLTFSIGIVVKEDGTVLDVVPAQPAARAGVGPGMKIIAVNGRRFTAETARDAVRATRERPNLDLLIENGEFFQTLRVGYRGGARYPALERNPSRPDRLAEILSPRTKIEAR